MVRHSTVLALAFALAACTFPPLETPTPRPTSTPSPTPAPTPSPPSPPSPTATPQPTPDPTTLIPDFGAAEIVATATDGLRVRQRPSLSAVVVTGLLRLDARLQVVMGPILVDELGWYLVTDADPAEPQFSEGWIAAGFEPEPLLRSTGTVSDTSPYLASFALTGSAEYGPIEIADDRHAIRWVAVDPERQRCRFLVELEPSDGQPVRAILATIGTEVVPGTLQPAFFAATPELRGHVFIRVETDCNWTLVVVRVPDPPGTADETPQNTPGGG